MADTGAHDHQRYCYVYAIVDRSASLPRRMAGLDGEALALVPWRALAAVVAPCGASCVRPSAEALLQHEAVVEAIHQTAPALPVRFGTVVPAATITQRLDEHYDGLRADLTRIGDNVELGLTVLWDAADATPESADGQSGRAASWEASLPSGAGAGTRYLLARKEAYRRDEATRRRAQVIASELDTRLKPCVRESRYDVRVAPYASVRAAYLLERGALPQARQALRHFQERNAMCRCILTGPWPPYSFVSARSGLTGAGDEGIYPRASGVVG